MRIGSKLPARISRRISMAGAITATAIVTTTAHINEPETAAAVSPPQSQRFKPFLLLL